MVIRELRMHMKQEGEELLYGQRLKLKFTESGREKDCCY